MATITGDLKLGFGVGLGVLLAFLAWGLFQMLLHRGRKNG
mgnify:CR=1 FL=1